MLDLIAWKVRPLHIEPEMISGYVTSDIGKNIISHEAFA
jgi:hypothetical protein